MSKPKDILGSGWQFPVRMDKADAIAMSHHENKIKESIIIILSTAKGERVMRPDFGCGIHDYVFDVIETASLTLIRSSVEEALVIWEPRIEVLSVDAIPENIDQGRIDIRVEYRVLYTNTAHNLVYPFFLDTEQN